MYTNNDSLKIEKKGGRKEREYCDVDIFQKYIRLGGKRREIAVGFGFGLEVRKRMEEIWAMKRVQGKEWETDEEEWETVSTRKRVDFRNGWKVCKEHEVHGPKRANKTRS